ncbi:MAG TPA: hypothetical protein VKU77_05540 [Streptosporangiaceae bacterium]|nr:hypothetical protein [Streptosporangiaceae bacterium]
MFRFLILLLGMVTTRAGRLDTSPVRRADEDEDEWEDPGRWLDGPRYASDDTWVVARDAQPPARLARNAEPPRLWPRDRMPPRRRRRLVPRWVKWAAVLALAGLVFRKAVAFTVLAVLSGAFHLVGLNVHLPHLKLAWPWTSITSGTTTDTDIGPWVLQKIEGISRPALGTENFNFVFTHKVSKSIGFWPCWYSSTFYAVGRASATVDLNPGPGWWAPGSGHYQLTTLSRPADGKAGRVAVTIVLPPPQLPQSVHDITVDNTLSHVISTDHSWTYPGFGCGALLKPQFAPSIMYAQAQNLAFDRATHDPQVTQPMIGAAENEAAQIIRNNFVQPTVNALGYTLAGFTLRWSGSA